MGANRHGLLIYHIFLLTIWLLSVLLPLRKKVIHNQFQQIPYTLDWETNYHSTLHVVKEFQVRLASGAVFYLLKVHQ